MASNKPIGTPEAGYAPPSAGPFQCANCVHFAWPHRCNHPDVVKDARAGHAPLKLTKSGEAMVRPGGCCNYFRTRGE